ncbi:MAG: hypothetical protein AVDCRST_MAG19-466 [uncultured Thermomicrobiales bacterium]|uniref:Uncharacterized protein n=1 Tax=uncultured Thermomicrobiales bacterium TaxID=1645740 RepID=A0A6J4UFZ0_9BACT|nr:MAG: hypothetical protein AVDCRST_MAG19-466 [uncultured Thermomicrobiales bacterium]
MVGAEVWEVATFGSRLCEGCRYLHGTLWPAGVGPGSGGGKLHNRCRCQRRPLSAGELIGGGPTGAIRAALGARANGRAAGAIEAEALLLSVRALVPRERPEPARWEGVRPWAREDDLVEIDERSRRNGR